MMSEGTCRGPHNPCQLQHALAVNSRMKPGRECAKAHMHARSQHRARTPLRRSGNALTGTLPASWGGALKAVAWLHLNDNRLAGTVPASWGALGSSLSVGLNLTVNPDLQGCIPKGLLAAVKAEGGCKGTRLTCSACP